MEVPVWPVSGLCSVLLTCAPVPLPVPRCPGHRSFTVILKPESSDPPASFSFRIVLSVLFLLLIHRKFRIVDIYQKSQLGFLLLILYWLCSYSCPCLFISYWKCLEQKCLILVMANLAIFFSLTSFMRCARPWRSSPVFSSKSFIL